MSELRELSSRSGPDTLVTPLCRAPIDHPSAWKVADFKTPADYTIELSATQLQDIERAMGQMKGAGLGRAGLPREQSWFPLLRPVLDGSGREIGEGRGLVVVPRLPVEDYSKDEIGM